MNPRYQIQKHGARHLLIDCPNCGRRHIPFISNLEIPTEYSKALLKAQQPNLFNQPDQTDRP